MSGSPICINCMRRKVSPAGWSGESPVGMRGVPHSLHPLLQVAAGNAQARDARMRERQCFRGCSTFQDMTNDRISEDASTSPAHPIVVLTGFMGSGKTSTGEALAGLLGWKFVDLDHEIETQEGSTIGALFAQKGEAEFRTIEHAALGDCVRNCDRPTVLALGGGAIVESSNASLVRE